MGMQRGVAPAAQGDGGMQRGPILAAECPKPNRI